MIKKPGSIPGEDYEKFFSFKFVFMATLVGEFRSFVKCGRWVCEENG